MGRQIKAIWSRAIPLNELSRLTRYILAATLARIGTGGSIVAIILLARAFGAEGKMAGALAACMTAPHAFGPIYGRWLDESQDPRLIIAGASFLFAGFFQLAILGFEWNLSWLTVSALLICGTCSSFLMGGLSTQLVHLVDKDVATRRRAQSWDTITYGVGLTMGPMLIAFFTTMYSTQLSISILMCLPFMAGLIILLLPKPSLHPTQEEEVIPGFRKVIEIIRHSGPLKRTLTMTSAASFSVAALPVLAIYFSEDWQNNQESGAYLVTLYGIGCLFGAVLLMLKPLKADALTLLRNVGAVLLLSLILLSVSQSFSAGLATYWLCGVVNSIFFAVTLAARSEYAPQQGAAQIYMWVAAAKISAASLGAFVAGFLVDQSITLPLIVSSAVLAITLILCFWRS
jgi:MFS family permease